MIDFIVISIGSLLLLIELLLIAVIRFLILNIIELIKSKDSFNFNTIIYEILPQSLFVIIIIYFELVLIAEVFNL